MSRLPSTGRRPALDLAGVESLLTSYFSDSQPSVADLASQLGVTQATVRKYLKLALGSLPRGRAACLPREARNVRALVNAIPTEALLGAGRVELLMRRRADGASLTALASDFGISRDRVTKLVRGQEPAEAAPEAPESAPEASAPESAPEVAEASPEASEESSES